jgi:hypothetical protein
MSLVRNRMRMQVHARIRRQIEYYQQRLRLISHRSNRGATCKYNAHSPFLLCAVNPSGSCEQCPHYEIDPDYLDPPQPRSSCETVPTSSVGWNGLAI